MQKILVIGSGPIIIGQAAEFDYAGSQACRSLKEEGFEVVLINSNPATIMTDTDMADAVYIEPLTPEFCRRVIEKERPDALLATLGGQTGLNLASQLAQAGTLEEFGVKMLGTQLEAIAKAEDRELFRDLMREIREPVAESWIVESVEELKEVADRVPYPAIVRPAYTLGGTGGGVAYDREELLEIGRKGLQLSMRGQLMVERSLLGWKEVEYEVMRDGKGNCITVCNMENFDPMGVHTGDSIVVAPSQTLSDIEYHMLRAASLKIISALKIEGGCNVQLAVNPDGFDYYVIEVNPRVSRSSALASKATGYPIARVAAKIAIGKSLDEIENQVTKTTKACFEPALDYCVVKIPRWPFDKFASGDRSLGTQMKATGEVMAIDRTFESAFMKAIRGLEVESRDLRHARTQAKSDEELERALRRPDDERLWAVVEAIRRSISLEEIYRVSRIDIWFLTKLSKLVAIEGRLVLSRATLGRSEPLEELVTDAMRSGFAGQTILQLLCADAASVALFERHDQANLVDLLKLDFELFWRLAQNFDYLPSAVKFETGERALRSAESYPSAPRETDSDELDEPVRFSSRDRDASKALPAILRGASVAEYLDYAGSAKEAVTEVGSGFAFKMVDTCSAEFASQTPYYYSTFGGSSDRVEKLGSLG